MPLKRRPRPREIEASRIILRDSKGNERIVLDAGGEDGHASICIVSAHARGNMQVHTQPNGSVVLSIGNEAMGGVLTLSAKGLTLRAQDGRLGIVVGPVVDGNDSVTVYRDGRPVWTSPAKRVSVSKSGRSKRRSSGGKTRSRSTGA